MHSLLPSVLTCFSADITSDGFKVKLYSSSATCIPIIYYYLLLCCIFLFIYSCVPIIIQINQSIGQFLSSLRAFVSTYIYVIGWICLVTLHWKLLWAHFRETILVLRMPLPTRHLMNLNMIIIQYDFLWREKIGN